MLPCDFILKRINNKTLVVYSLLVILTISHISMTNNLAVFFTTENEFDNFSEGNIEHSSVSVPPLIGSTISISAVTGDNDLLSVNDFESGIAWDNATILDSSLLPVTPKNAIDTNDNLHIVWTNWYDGRKLYHQIRYANGNLSEKAILINKPNGESITCDIVADSFGKVHLAYSWGDTLGTHKLSYAFWESGIWSSFERVDFGVNEYGHPLPASYPLIRVTSDGNPHVIWSGQIGPGDDSIDTHPIYYQKRISAGVWSDILFSGCSNPETYSFLITKDDYFYVGTSIKAGKYALSHLVNIRRKGPTDNSWRTNDELGSYRLPNGLTSIPNVKLIEVGDTLHCFGVYVQDEDSFIFDFMSKGVLWDTFDIVTTDIIRAETLHLTATAVNDTDIVLAYNWYFYENGTLTSGIYHKTLLDNNTEWSDNNPISINHSKAKLPEIASDSMGNLHITWRDYVPALGGHVLCYNYGLSDRDRDGLSNYDELIVYLTDPNDPDSDDDLLLDGDEIALGMDPLNPDEDSDLILDGWEITYNLDPFNATDASIDQDVDGLINLEEFNYQTDPTNNDTDSDGLLDGPEAKTHFTNPTDADSDDDELSDGAEILTWFTDALNNDTDTDGMPDGYETQNSLDPLVDDAGGDLDLEGLTNIEEYQEGTDPNNNDTDIDLISDWEEVFIGTDGFITNPLSNDTDGDFLTDYYEIVIDPLDDTYLTNNIYQTSPNLADNDSDLLSDFFEINISLTNPLENDTDSDLMIDGYEWTYGLDPFTDDAENDPDGDSLTNYVESTYFSNPFDEDTDGDDLLDDEEVAFGTSLILYDTDWDGLSDYQEVVYYYTNPLDPDTDHDGLNDYYEKVYYITNPFNNDTDGDTLLDGYEVYTLGSNPVSRDTDRDKLEDQIELAFNSSLLISDTDFDGMDDFWEWTYGFDPQFDESAEDADGDGLTNYEEYRFFAHPHKNDTDADSLGDFEEIYLYLTYPFDNDTDNDLLLDNEEIITYGTNAHDPDTDDDSLSDGDEVLIYLTNPLLYDSDFDGYSDSEEIIANTNPLNAQSNPRNRRITLITSIFSSVIGGILIYYFTPFLFTKASGKREGIWIKIGRKKRDKKSEEILKAVQREIEESAIKKEQ